jgi:hypothetical protein
VFEATKPLAGAGLVLQLHFERTDRELGLTCCCRPGLPYRVVVRAAHFQVFGAAGLEQAACGSQPAPLGRVRPNTANARSRSRARTPRGRLK